jgi:hypothetical protein
MTEKLQIEKDKSGADAASEKLPSVDGMLELLKKDLSGYDPYFSVGIFHQLAELERRKVDDAVDTIKLGFARSILKTVTPGNQIEMLMVTQMIAVHDAMMNFGRFLANSKTLREVESYGNMFNKLARTFVGQTEALKRFRSGDEQKVTVQNVSVSDGGQAIVGNITQNTADKDRAGDTKASPVITGQSGKAIPIVQPDEQSATTVPRIEQNQQPDPSATRHRRRA